MRSFLAVEIPPDIRQRLGELQGELRASEADVKWVRPESIHLTLKFLGEIPSDQVGLILEGVRHAAEDRHRFDLDIRGMGCFPGLTQPRVVWVGLGGKVDELVEIQQAIEEQMHRLQFSRQERPFRPHLTVGRVRSQKGRLQLISRIQDLSDVRLGSFTVESIIQFRSELHPKGAIYTALGEVPLSGAG